MTYILARVGGNNIKFIRRVRFVSNPVIICAGVPLPVAPLESPILSNDASSGHNLGGLSFTTSLKAGKDACAALQN